MPQEITPEDVERSLTPVEKRWTITDTVAPGLMLRAGAKAPAWYLRITKRGQFKAVLGHPPSMSLDVARQVAKQALADHLSGVRIDDDWIRKRHREHGVRAVAEPAPAYVEPEGPWTWSQTAEGYLRWLEFRGRSPVTIQGNRKALMQVLSRFADRPFAEVTADDVQAALDQIAEQYPALAEVAMKSARPMSHWAATGGRHLKSGTRVHRYRSLTVPPPETRRPRGFQPVSLDDVARLVAMARAGVLADSVARALEFIVLSGLPRSVVCPLRHDDVRDGVLTVRAELLRRRDPIKLPLTPRLKALLRSDHDQWAFPQPRKAHRSRHRSHMRAEALGRATWEIPGVSTATEAQLAMRDWLARHYTPNDMIDRLTDSGGNDDDRDEAGAAVWEHRGWMVAEWSDAVLPLVDAQAASIDPAEVKAAMRAKRPSQD